MEITDIIIRPLLTEKSNILREGLTKKYIFRIDPRANKFQVKNAVEVLFKVKAVDVKIVNVKGKARSVALRGGIRGVGFTSSWKKAYVTLAKNQKIDKFEGV